MGDVASPPSPKADAGFKETAWLVFRGLVAYAAVHLVAMVLAKNRIAAAAVQAGVTEFAAGRLGIRWNEGDPETVAIARRAGKGLMWGLAGGVLMVAWLVVTRAANFYGVTFVPSHLVSGLLVSVLAAVRDELLLRGLVLRALAGVREGWLIKVATCGVAASAARFGASTATPMELACAALIGTTLGLIWLFDRGAWMAWGANVGFSVATGAMSHGGLFDIQSQMTPWGGAEAGFQGGIAGALFLVLLGAATLFFLRRHPIASPVHERP